MGFFPDKPGFDWIAILILHEAGKYGLITHNVVVSNIRPAPLCEGRWAR
jgi:hypothetical protein